MNYEKLDERTLKVTETKQIEAKYDVKGLKRRKQILKDELDKINALLTQADLLNIDKEVP